MDRDALAKVLYGAGDPQWAAMYSWEKPASYSSRDDYLRMADAALAWFAEHLDDGSNPLEDAARNLINVVNGCTKPVPTDVLVAVEILAALTGAHDAR